ncbi:MAG: CotH kinase family protein, partial [Akkermansiaceae bacterium]|nr:CotH kinase family protein [Akkermansiaceae bacterium]
IRLSDAVWSTAWTSVSMRDDGTGGDAVADDDIFTAVVPGSVQQHRHLIRYRVAARDRLLDSIRVPYADDACPNFAWFCYDGVPAWTGAARPGTTAADTFDVATMSKVRPWHLLSRESDVLACQYSGSDDGIYRYEGCVVIDGTVYDHVRYRVKGQNSTFVAGKNKWKFKFNRGRELQLPDDRGLSASTVRTLNLSSLTEPWAPWNRGLAGLDEAVVFKLFNLAGVAAPETSFLQLRVIDSPAESNSADQYDGDLWGLYLAFGNLDNRFKEAQGLPDGNIFQLEGGMNELTGQGSGQPGDLSDLNSFINGYLNGRQTEAWFRANVDLTKYSSWRAITEAVNNTDRREQENMAYFRNPIDGRWSIHPWDSDLLYEQLARWGPLGVQSHAAYEHVQNALLHPAIRIDWQNRCRELQDLLLNSDQSWKIMDEIVSFTANEIPRLIPADPLGPGYAVNPGFIEVDRRMWDWHPRSTSKGIFYVTPYPIGAAVGSVGPYPADRTLATGDFSGMLKWTKDFVATDPHGGGRLGTLAAGTVNPLTFATGETPAAIPATPALSYAGPAGFPANALVFQSGDFNADGGTPCSGMEWRIGEISDPSVPGFDPARPWIYEIIPVWTSPVLAGFSAAIIPPATDLIPGRTYRARVRHRNTAGHWSHWSAPVEFIAGIVAPGNLATDLVITEIMYNPPEGADLEFIELQNISSTSPLVLGGLRFTAGIEFTFPDTLVVQPGGYVIVVRNHAAFEAKYGAGLPIAGEYLTTSLNNAGETLTLSLGPAQVLRTVPYDDAFPWPVAPDGSGSNLVLIAPHTNPDHSDPFSWRAGSTSPGATDAISYTAWKLAHDLSGDGDPDGDGVPNLIEYTLGGDPAVSDQTCLPVFTQHPDGSLTVTLTRVLRADDVGWELQETSDLSDWRPISGVILQSRDATATTETLTLTVPGTPPEVGARFFRFCFTRR